MLLHSNLVILLHRILKMLLLNNIEISQKFELLLGDPAILKCFFEMFIEMFIYS